MVAFAASVQLDTLTDTEPDLREGTQLYCIGRTHLRRRMQQTQLPSSQAAQLGCKLFEIVVILICGH